MSDRLIESGRACPGLDHGARLKVSKATDGCRERCSMTDHEMNEMRIRLAEAMGWMDLRAGAVRTLSGVLPAQNILVRTEVPDPLERDQDAAMLRAWCAAQGWRITCCHDEGAAWWRVSDLRCQGARAESMVDAKEEPDYCRRERVALCQAVLQVVEAGGEA